MIQRSSATRSMYKVKWRSISLMSPPFTFKCEIQAWGDTGVAVRQSPWDVSRSAVRSAPTDTFWRCSQAGELLLLLTQGTVSVNTSARPALSTMGFAQSLLPGCFYREYSSLQSPRRTATDRLRRSLLQRASCYFSVFSACILSFALFLGLFPRVSYGLPQDHHHSSWSLPCREQSTCFLVGAWLRH